MDGLSYKQKYEYLLNLIEIQDVDLWEKDAMMCISRTYFQFWDEHELKDKDKVVEACMNDWYCQRVVNGENK